jgi:hypothetical protein
MRGQIDQLSKADVELRDTTARLKSLRDAASDDVETVRAQARDGWRRLLTEKGNLLSQVVHEALIVLGYEVKDLDRESLLEDGGGRREDYRIVDPDDARHDPIVEVKGYDRGARAGDLGKLFRHETRAVRSGRTPTGIWFVVNFSRYTAPDDRGIVLAGEDALTDGSAEEDTPLLVIDTRDLFSAIRSVESSRVSAAAVRQSLRRGRGRWTPPIEERTPDAAEPGGT